jgi:hypothetical protein
MSRLERLPGVVDPERLIVCPLLHEHFGGVGGRPPAWICEAPPLHKECTIELLAVSNVSPGSIRRSNGNWSVSYITCTPSFQSGDDLGALQVSRSPVHHQEPFVRFRALHRDRGVVHAARIIKLPRLNTVERRDLDIARRRWSQVHRLEDEMAEGDGRTAPIADREPFLHRGMPRIYRIEDRDVERLGSCAQADGKQPSVRGDVAHPRFLKFEIPPSAFAFPSCNISHLLSDINPVSLV